KRTDTEYCHWRIIDTTDKQFTRFQLFNILVSQITNAVNSEPHYPIPADVTTMFPMQKTPLLSEVSLENKVIKPSKYPEELKKCQKQLAKLHGKIYKKKIPVVIAFEGWDAAGKGGAIKRLGAAFDPRGYEAVPVAAPEKYELERHYLWRFWRKLPKTGHITIFDRTWYGRVMVEKLEGLTPEARCAMAYREIDEFERELTRSGVILIKFWMQIDKDEQLKRFNERMENPEKQWKITDEDWRNREKWDLYETAVNEMLEKTSTAYAPWTIVESNDKLYARIKVMNTVIDRLEEALKK
ncbi:MAG: phosphate--AMP phosphotransferase, partial [Oscillospiraceae bacterium]